MQNVGESAGPAVAVGSCKRASPRGFVDAPADSFGSSTIWAAAKNDVWIGSTHFDGTSWTSAPGDGHVGTAAIWRRSANEVWFLDSMGNVLRFDGTRMSHVTTLSVAGSMIGAGNDLWLVGHNGGIVHKPL